ncbi:MAG TPA: hypothetical protein VL574_01040 [Stellaceae bacterium]|nr:hypothetical protein [Stellaceae bacterium]
MPDATHPTSIKHRWLEDDAVVLQLREVNQTEGSILDHAPDRDVAKALLVSLCLIRQSGDLRSSLERV